VAWTALIPGLSPELHPFAHFVTDCWRRTQERRRLAHHRSRGTMTRSSGPALTVFGLPLSLEGDEATLNRGRSHSHSAPSGIRAAPWEAALKSQPDLDKRQRPEQCLVSYGRSVTRSPAAVTGFGGVRGPVAPTRGQVQLTFRYPSETMCYRFCMPVGNCSRVTTLCGGTARSGRQLLRAGLHGRTPSSITGMRGEGPRRRLGPTETS
jgi:hypothetical protein